MNIILHDFLKNPVKIIKIPQSSTHAINYVNYKDVVYVKSLNTGEDDRFYEVKVMIIEEQYNSKEIASCDSQ